MVAEGLFLAMGADLSNMWPLAGRAFSNSELQSDVVIAAKRPRYRGAC